MDSVIIQIKGLADVQRKLYAFSQQLGDRVVVSALRQGANLVSREAKARAPVRTGIVKRSISVRKSKLFNGRRTSDKIGVYLTLKRRGKAGRKNPRDPFYGKFIEDGFTTRNGRKINGRQFIKGAFAARQNEAVRLIVNAAEAGASIVARKTGFK